MAATKAAVHLMQVRKSLLPPQKATNPTQTHPPAPPKTLVDLIHIKLHEIKKERIQYDGYWMHWRACNGQMSNNNGLAVCDFSEVFRDRGTNLTAARHQSDRQTP